MIEPATAASNWAERFADGEANPVRVHLIGVAGSGMSGLASLLIGLGHRVSGSDKVTTVETERLESVGLQFSCPHSAEAVADAEVVIYSSAVKQGNLAFDGAVEKAIPLLRRAEALAAIMNGRKSIVVAGTHGKTTTSALAAHVLRTGGKTPSHYVGAEIPILGTNAHFESGSEWFVAEGDESDGTLVNFTPEHAILLNVEAEHLDFYEDLDAILRVFQRFSDQTRGTVFYCGEDENATAVCAGRGEGKAVSYGWNPEFDYSAADLKPIGAGTEFSVLRKGELWGRVRLGIPGHHNVLNALAAIAVARELGVSLDRIDEALSGFRGAKRRFEIKRQSDFVTIVDDYGHHPTEIAATIQTARSQHEGRLICLFQPHRYTRTQLLQKEFGTAFDGVDELFVTDIYPASEKPIPGITGETIVDSVNRNGRVRAHSLPDRQTMHLAIGNSLKAGDWVMTLGAGDIHEVGARLAKDLRTLDELKSILAEEAVLKLYEPMGKHTTLKVGGPAQFWVEPATVAGLARLVKYCCDTGLRLRVVGRGSNLLVRDGGIPGVVANPVRGEFTEITDNGDGTITAGAGVKYKALTAAAQTAGLGGFEWMEGIPGNVGGSLRMNAGAMGGETFEQVVSVRMIDGEGNVFEKPVAEIDARYRNVPELAHNVAVSAVFRGDPAPADEIAEKIEASKEKRRTSQPVAASAGCIFKNPGPIGAGQLVDELGLKGTGVGASQVSEIHGNFIVNNGGASAADVLELIERIKAKARVEREIELETEVQIVGQDESV